MKHCDRDDVENVYPGITDGLSDQTVDALCVTATHTINHFVLAPTTDADIETLKLATANQVVAYIQTGDLQNYGLHAQTEIVLNGEKLRVGSHICWAAKMILAAEGLTTPWGV